MSKVAKSAKRIAEQAEDVNVDTEACKKTATSIKKRIERVGYSQANWSAHPLNPTSESPNVVDWIFTVDTLNFSFWSDEPRFTVNYKGVEYTGYWSLVAAINRALDAGVPITDPQFWVSEDFNLKVISKIFKSDGNDVEVPLLNERFQVLREAGEALQKCGFTSFEDVLNLNKNKSALFVLDWVSHNIPSFNDSASYHGETVYILKRAQILVGDLWACFKGKGFGEFSDIQEITMFADYRVPQILYAMGCIKYTPRLYNKIQSKELLTSKSQEEVEIRGCTIWAVELIVKELRKLVKNSADKSRLPEINAVLVDFYLWDTAKEEEDQNTKIVECHRVRSVYY